MYDTLAKHRNFYRDVTIEFLTLCQWCCQLCVDKLYDAKSCVYGTCHTDSQPPAGKREINISVGSDGVTLVSEQVYKTKRRDSGRQKGYARGLLH